MTETTTLLFGGGVFTLEHTAGKNIVAYRSGEPWRYLTSDLLARELVFEIETLREEIAEMRNQLRS